MVTILNHTAELQRSAKYSKWHARACNWDALATLRSLTAEFKA